MSDDAGEADKAGHGMPADLEDALEEADEAEHGVPADLEEALEEADEEAGEEADPGRFDAPPLPPLLVLAIVGLLAGFVTIAMIWLSEQGCNQIRDTPNCGPVGFPLLILTVV